ncbi:hypothetical protein [Xenorhabdus innexi]|uniref:Uncharacterized protein n=1 Tax=Xenorhabdus innexi TaxID=290109 RepID=A0A1N6MWI2_9GAMM|nr:hypothetical protein [Xenorhabdus innexi]PHM35936.1 hypothetical protein Xinn_02006 [Xenorhabdus innexi]SIP73235.1 hypothetical protein XIS1_1790041 [Xenorhabdus innexi]
MSNCCSPILTLEQVSNYIQSVINQKIICNEIQAGLLDCQGNVLAPATHVIKCDQLNKLAQDAIHNGDIAIPGIVAFSFDGERITLVDQRGTTHGVNLASIVPQSVTTMGMTVTLTLKDGTQLTADFTKAVTEAIAGKTLKSAVLTKDNHLELTLGDGSKVTTDLGQLLNDATVTSGNIDTNGDIELVLGNGKVIKVLAAALRRVKIDRDSPLTGNGDDVPLNIDFTRVCWKVIDSITMDDTGLHIKIDNQCDAITLSMDEIKKALVNKVKVCVANTGFITGDGTEGHCLDLDLQKVINAFVANQNVMTTLINSLNNKIKVSVNNSLTGSGIAADPLGVKLSADGGNLLTIRNNGLYYGVEATKDVSKLFVDSVAGDDTHAGNDPKQPLKTLQEALKRIPADQSNTIFLRCGGEYIWPGFAVTNGAQRNIQAYGDPLIDGDKVPKLTPERPSYNWWAHSGFTRPKIYYLAYYTPSIQVYDIYSCSPQGGGQLVCTGLQFMCEAVNEPGTSGAPKEYTADWVRWDTYGVYGMSDGKVIYYGCIFQNKHAPAAAQKNPSEGKTETWWGITGKNSVLEGAQQTFVACSYANLSQNPHETKFPGDLIGESSGMSQLSVTNYTDNYGDLPGYEYIDQNMAAALKLDGLVTGIVFDSEGKPRNLISNVILGKP